MTERILNASMEARKGVMNLKLVRAFIAFVVVSLVVGIGSAFNGQTYTPVEETNNPVEIIETEKIVEEESTEMVDKNILEKPVEEESKTNNSFSASKDEKSSSNVQETKKKQTTSNTQATTNNSNNNINQSIPQNDTEKVETKKEETINSPTDNSNNDDKINSTYYSITKGIPEYDTESACKSAGLSIQNKELDAILDWNEEHPDNPKSRSIGSSMCIIVMKDGKEHWFLHFLTISGENLDDELKRLYK